MLTNFVSFILYYFGGWQFLFWLYRILTGRTAIAVFMYHRVVRERRPEYLQGYEKGLLESDYLPQIREISKLFRVVSLEEFNSIVKGETKPYSSKPLALLTFDDGDSDNLTLAFPALIKQNLPAVSFIATSFIDSPRRFYHLRVTNAFNNLSDDGWKQASQVAMPTDMKAVFDSHCPNFRENKYPIRRALIVPMDRLSPDKRDRIIDEWERLAGGKYTLGIECMTWDQIVALPAKNIAVGSHTVDHNQLELVSIESAKRELTESKSILESKLGHKVTAICYPQGSFNESIVIEAATAGYETGFTTVPGLVDYPLDVQRRLTIPRIGTGRGKPHQIVFPVGKALIRHLFFPKSKPSVVTAD